MEEIFLNYFQILSATTLLNTIYLMKDKPDIMKYSCPTTDSIQLMAEAACIPDISIEVATMVSEDATFRLRQIIARAIKFMRHAKRTKLTCADINKALKWSDCQPVFGHECNPNQRLRYSYSTEARVFRYENNQVDLEQRYKEHPRTEELLSKDMMQEAMPRLKIEKLS